MMRIKRKYLDGRHLKDIQLVEHAHTTITAPMPGLLSYYRVGQVGRLYPLDYAPSIEKSLFEKNSLCISLLPDGTHWCLSLLLDAKMDIVEWYIDMLLETGMDGNGNPYFDDLFLDIALSPSYEAIVLDEDELDQALMEGIITPGQHQLAQDTATFLLRDILPNRAFLHSLLDLYHQHFPL